jgi:hypothetical protein
MTRIDWGASVFAESTDEGGNRIIADNQQIKSFPDCHNFKK